MTSGGEGGQLSGLRTGATSATTVDGTGERPVFTDGPYRETKEYMNGFWVIDAADLDSCQWSLGVCGRVEGDTQ